MLGQSRKGQAIRFKESLARSDPWAAATGGVIGMRLTDDDRVLVRGTSPPKVRNSSA